MADSYRGGAGGLEFLEPCFEVFVVLEVVADFGWGVPFLNFDVEVWEVAWFFVELVAMLGVVGWVDRDDSAQGVGDIRGAARRYGSRRGTLGLA